VKGIFLLSGGMDSTTLFANVLNEGWILYPLSINYGQKHLIEIEAAEEIVYEYQRFYFGRRNVKDLRILNFDLSQIGHSALTDTLWKVPEEMKDQIQTVVPFRNTILATLAAAYGESLELDPITIFMTPVKEDFEVYRDCRRDFYDALEKTLSLGSIHGVQVEIKTPFIDMTKKEIVALGIKLCVPYKLTYSCYKGLRPACGKCPACVERLEAFKANGLTDPLEYLIS
jgi:7-cyano-7-deazaguanine synthase